MTARPASWFKRAFFWSMAAIGLVVAALLFNMGLTPSRQRPPLGPAPPTLPEAEQQKLAERLGQAVRFPTVSTTSGSASPDSLRALHSFIEAKYPLLHATLTREVVGDFSLLYVWHGQEEAQAGGKAHKPYLLLAHQDVVPVEAGTESGWQQPPFSGAIADGYVWGRGTLDDKDSLMGILEAVERLLGAGYKPQRTIYLAFGHDEEISGEHGAMAIVALLRQRGLRFDFALDEGHAITKGLTPGLQRPLAIIGLSEKGHLSAELAVSAEGGHSSMPPRQTSVGILCQAVARVEQHQMPTVLHGPTQKLFETLAPELPLALRLVTTNLWLFKPLISYQLLKEPSGNALLRTTTAPTMLEGSPKDNVLAQNARAVVNFRLFPGDTSEAVLEHIREVVDDPRVTVRALPGKSQEASPESSDKAPAFDLLAGTIRQVFPDTLVSPGLTLGATDGRHYADIADNVYRFAPIRLVRQDLARIHGTNERISIADYARGVSFYEQLIRNADTHP